MAKKSPKKDIKLKVKSHEDLILNLRGPAVPAQKTILSKKDKVKRSRKLDLSEEI